MHVVVIGGTGHVGTYLVPRLVEADYDVTVVCRGQRAPYQSHGAWSQVNTVIADREQEDAAGAFGQRMADLAPDIVIDMICFEPDSARQLATALHGTVSHFLHCGTVWVHGPSVEVPTREDQCRTPFGDYGIKKAAIESMLLDEARRGNLPATVVHPGHIVGPGWHPINPAGNTDLHVFTALIQGKQLLLPNLGMETLHHVHADDVAQVFVRAMSRWSNSVGESFHAVSPAAVTLRGYAEVVAGWFGKTADLAFAPYGEWAKTVDENNARMTHDHICHSPNCSIDKARELLGYAPRYRSFEAIHESLTWLLELGNDC